jgi:hypothetical protein
MKNPSISPMPEMVDRDFEKWMIYLFPKGLWRKRRELRGGETEKIMV